mgnify:CR=1 FL=1
MMKSEHINQHNDWANAPPSILVEESFWGRAIDALSLFLY